MRTIRIAAALLVDGAGRTLLVRKRGTTAFMQPGGKIEPDETPVAALVRELAEELGLRVAPAAATYLGQFAADAAHEDGAVVEAELFRVDAVGDVAPAREIEEVRWVDVAGDAEMELAPLTRDVVLPLWRAVNDG